MEKEFWGPKHHLSSYLIVSFLAVLILVLQGSFLAFFIIDGVMPDLLLILVVGLAFLWGEKRGAAAGFIAGMLQDFFFGPALGFFTLSKVIPAYLAGLMSRDIYKDQVIVPMVAVFFATLLHELISFFLVGLFWGHEFPMIYYLEQKFLPQAIYNFLLTLLIYPLLYKAEQHRIFYPSLK